MALIRTGGSSAPTFTFNHDGSATGITANKCFINVVRSGAAPSLSLNGTAQTYIQYDAGLGGSNPTQALYELDNVVASDVITFEGIGLIVTA